MSDLVFQRPAKYALRLPDGETVTGAVSLPSGGFLPPGCVGVLRAAIVHAEIGVTTGLAEPQPGQAQLVDLDRGLCRLVDLREVEAQELR